jgi:hypothetical protein
MTALDQLISSTKSARPIFLTAVIAAMSSPACEVGIHDFTDFSVTGGTGNDAEDGDGPAGGGDGDSVGSGGRPSSSGGGAPSGGAAPIDCCTDGGSTFVIGGAAGSSNTELEWLEAQGTQCEASTVSPTALPSEPSLDCTFFEIGLPGVLEYTIDPSAFNLDRDGVGGIYEYLGCDDLDSPCVGRIEYSWEVEYLADNEWYLALSPVHPACDYDHVLWHNLPSGVLSPRGTLSWTSLELILHLQPTATGLTVGAVRSDLDEELEVGAFTEMEYNGGWFEGELRGMFDDAFIDHLKALEWECDQP